MGKFIIEIFLHTFRCSFYFLASCQTVSVTRCAPWWTSWAGSSASCSSQRWISQSLSLGPEWAGFVSLTPPGVRPLGLGMPLTFLHTCSCNGEPQLYLLQKKKKKNIAFILSKHFFNFCDNVATHEKNCVATWGSDRSRSVQVSLVGHYNDRSVHVYFLPQTTYLPFDVNKWGCIRYGVNHYKGIIEHTMSVDLQNKTRLGQFYRQISRNCSVSLPRKFSSVSSFPILVLPCH